MYNNPFPLFQDTGTLVQVFTDPLPGSGEHVVALKNNEADSIVEAAAAVYDLIQEVRKIRFYEMFDPPPPFLTRSHTLDISIVPVDLEPA